MNDTTTPQLWGVLTERVDGPALRVEHTFRTSAEDLWRAVTEPERMARWMAPTTLDGPAGVGRGTSSTSGRAPPAAGW